MQKLAESKGGKCLSEEYVDNHTKLRWQCKEGHIWDALPHSLKQGDTWCPICGRKKQRGMCHMNRMAMMGMTLTVEPRVL